MTGPIDPDDPAPAPDDTPAFVDEPGTDRETEPALVPDALIADAPDTSTGKQQLLAEEDRPGPGV